MERPLRLLVVLGLLAALLPAAAATFGPQPGSSSCEPTLLATQVALFCAPDMPTAQCCEPVVAAVDLGGGVPCLCRVAAEPQLVIAGLNATHLLTLYTSCGGIRPGGAHLAAACEGPAPPAAADVSSPPPSPAPRRKPPAHEAPLPPSSDEKPSPPPQQHAGAAHSKAIPAYEATSPLAPAAALSPAAPNMALLPAAAATFVPQPGSSSCEPTLLATQVALFCAPDMPTAQCCEPVVAAVDLGGGVPCLCRVAAEPQLFMAGLNATHLLTLYTSCGGLRPGGVHLAAFCEGPATPPAADVRSPPPSPAPRRKSPAHEAPPLVPSRQILPLSEKRSVLLEQKVVPQAIAPCDFQKMAVDISEYCGTNIPNSTCCMAIVASVDIGGCLCKVIIEEAIITGPFSARHILFLYNACGGLRPISYQNVLDCDLPVTPPSPRADCNETMSHEPLDGYRVPSLHTVFLALILFFVAAQSVFFACLWLKGGYQAGRAATPRAADFTRISAGGLPLHSRVHSTMRLTQSDGGARSSFLRFPMFTPARLNERSD